MASNLPVTLQLGNPGSTIQTVQTSTAAPSSPPARPYEVTSTPSAEVAAGTAQPSQFSGACVAVALEARPLGHILQSFRFVAGPADGFAAPVDQSNALGRGAPNAIAPSGASAKK